MTGVRLAAAQSALTEQGIDALLISVGSDLPYLTGYRAMPLERITALVVPAVGDPALFVPELEAPRVDASVEVRPWGEIDDPFDRIAGALPDRGIIAVGDQMWAAFLIAFQERLPDARFVDAEPLMGPLRMIKDEDEIAALRDAAHAVDGVADHLSTVRFSGRTEREVSRIVADLVLASGHESVSFAIVAAGTNGASPHHEASDQIIQPGDAVVVDFGGRVRGYGSDTTRMYCVRETPRGFHEAYAVLERAQNAAVESVRPGTTAEAIDAAARSVISDGGYGEFFIHRTGHGIGLDAHEQPYIVQGNAEPIRAGMAFSIEPGIYVPDRWGMRIEDIVVATDDGVERLNRSSRELRFVE
ncbi:MAG: Xaa-Pro peptidase family protein [Actinomycetota bacterium]|nr:Xaa-Pro peptidase family protein [Actinomycetota bacterium]